MFSVSVAAESRVRISRHVYEELLSRIISGALPPEGRITIDALGRDLGLSQTPIREALHRLEADGLVIRAHLAGYRVAPRLTREKFESLVEIRVILEPAAARLAAVRASAEDLQRVSTIASTMTPEQLDPASERAYATFSRRDADFHHAIGELSGNDFVHDGIIRLHTHAHLFRLSERADITALALDEHARVVDALRNHDGDTAEAAMREHIEQSALRFRRAFDES